jgi:peptidoglycan-N-acetylglucosamine deacetylase
MIFTTSWDDGDALDLRLADLLRRYGIKGTFYVSKAKLFNQPKLTDLEIRGIGESFEVGAHTIHHPNLPKLSDEEVMKELSESKEWVERVTGKPCEMFCYPKGYRDPRVQSLVRKAGFKGARGVEAFRFSYDNPFTLPVSLQIYPMPWRKKWTQWWHPMDVLHPVRRSWKSIRALRVPLVALRGWGPFAEWLFDYALETRQPMFHLFGHSYEVNLYGFWEKVEKFLEHVAKSDVTYCTNGELLSLLPPAPTDAHPPAQR